MSGAATRESRETRRAIPPGTGIMRCCQQAFPEPCRRGGQPGHGLSASKLARECQQKAVARKGRTPFVQELVELPRDFAVRISREFQHRRVRGFLVEKRMFSKKVSLPQITPSFA